MEENIFKDYLEGYVNIHNELLDLDISDKTAEIERLEEIAKANDMLVQNSMKVEDIDSNDKEKHKEFEIKTKTYMENIRKAEKEIEDIHKQQKENKKRKEELEKALKDIRKNAKNDKEEKVEEAKKEKLNNITLKKYEDDLKQEEEIKQKLKKFENIELETTKEELERIQLENELRTVQADRKMLKQQLNQQSDKTKKVEKDYILFLGQLSLIDRTPEKIEVQPAKNKNAETKTEETEKEETKTANDDKEMSIEEKINKVKAEFEADNRDYKNIHLKADKRDVKKVGQEQYADGIKSIYINEKEGKIYKETKYGEKIELSLEEALEDKKDAFKSLGIGDMCAKTSETFFAGLLLRAKVNPAIIKALGNDKQAIEEYIKCLHEKKELPFELSHDLRNSKLGMLDRMKMWVHARAEDKIPGTRITFTERFWNKNKALPEENKKEETNQLEHVKVQNKDNEIEKKASEAMKTTEEKLAKDVEEMTK